MRYFVSFLIVIGLIILVFILILKGFSGGTNAPAAPPLINYATTSTKVQMTIDGPETADQTHQSVEITVGQDQSELDVFQGYQGTVINSQSYNNNESAYAVFLRALDLAGYTKGDSSSALSDDRGYCPLGDRYVFGIVNGSRNIERYWTTSCGGTHTFDGETGIVQSLFTDQIPNYSSLTSGVNI